MEKSREMCGQRKSLEISTFETLKALILVAHIGLEPMTYRSF